MGCNSSTPQTGNTDDVIVNKEESLTERSNTSEETIKPKKKFNVVYVSSMLMSACIGGS